MNGYWNDKEMKLLDQFKAKAGLEALREAKTIQEIATNRQLQPTQMSTWKRQAIESMASFFRQLRKLRPKTARLKSFTPRLG